MTGSASSLCSGLFIRPPCCSIISWSEPSGSDHDQELVDAWISRGGQAGIHYCVVHQAELDREGQTTGLVAEVQ